MILASDLGRTREEVVMVRLTHVVFAWKNWVKLLKILRIANLHRWQYCHILSYGFWLRSLVISIIREFLQQCSFSLWHLKTKSWLRIPGHLVFDSHIGVGEDCKSYGMWHYVIGQVVYDVPKDRSVCEVSGSPRLMTVCHIPLCFDVHLSCCWSLLKLP
jgi:hypothetical protein